MKKWLRDCLRLFYPARCCVCGRLTDVKQPLCVCCQKTVPFIQPPVCDRCGRQEDRCVCRRRQRAFARCVSPFYHEGLVRDAVTRLKNKGYTDDVEGLAGEMMEVVRREYGGIAFSCVTAVPLYKKDYRRRGFNDADLLGRALAARLDVPYKPLLQKIWYTRPQKELKALERSGNLLGVFDVTEPDAVAGQTVLLVDDVITTGATLDECAKMLKIYGAQEVYAVTVAATLLKKTENDV